MDSLRQLNQNFVTGKEKKVIKISLLTAYIHQSGYELTRFDNLNEIKEKSCPKIIILPKRDTIVFTSSFQNLQTLNMKKYQLEIKISVEDFPQILMLVNGKFIYLQSY